MDSTALIQLFDELVDTSKQLVDEIQSEQKGFWLPIKKDQDPKSLQALNLACQLIQDFWYQDGQDGRATRSSFGFIALPEHTLKRANNVNHIKENFKQQVNAFQKKHKDAWLSLKGDLGKRHPSLQEQLHFSGLSRLHLKQTWRTLPVIMRSPSRIGFNWYQSGRSITKITVQQAYDALARLDTQSKHIAIQLDAVSRLSANTPLAKVQNLAPTMRANLFYEDGQSPLRQAMNTSLPILIKAREDQLLPEHNSPEIEPPTSRVRAVRSDRKIEDTPFLPSIRVHKYG